MHSIKAKIVACIVMFVLVSLAMVVSTLVTVSKQEYDTAIINKAGKQRMLTQKMIKEFYVYYTDAGEDEVALKVKEDKLKATINLFDRTLIGLIDGDPALGLPEAETPEIRAQLLKILELWAQFVTTFETGFAEGFFEEEEAFLNNNNIALLKEMNGAVTLIGQASRDKVAFLEQMQYLFLIVSIVMGIVIFILAKVMIVHRLEQLAVQVGEITNTRDLTKRLDSSDDEIGGLAKGFNFFLDEFQTLLGDVVQATVSVNRLSSELSEASSKMESDATQQQDQTDQVAAAIEEMNVTAQEVASNSTSASEFASEASQVATEGGEVVRQTIESIKQIAETVGNSSKIISALGDNSDKIGQIVAVIEDIAAQTNLLALNAAIEAARAGEQGRGFAVVADEVRNLARRTSDATNEIAGMIGTIQSDTKNAVVSMESGTQQVEEGVDLANQAGGSLGRIVEVVGGVTDMVRQIATAAEEQTSVSDEIGRNITAVAEITRETVHLSQQSSQGSQVLMQQVDELQQKISQFKL